MKQIVACLLAILMGVALQARGIAADTLRNAPLMPASLGAAPEFVSTLPLLQIGQGEGPFAAAFSPDRTRVATGGIRGAFIWDVETGELLRTFTGHTAEVTAVAYSNDGSRIATGSADWTARIWDANTGTELHTLAGHTNRIRTVAFSSDDTLVATGSADSSFRVWDATTGELRRSRSLLSSPGALVFSSDGAWLLVGSDDDQIRLWDWEGNFLLRTWQGHTDAVTAVAFSPDELQILSGAGNGEVKVWDFDTALELHSSQEHLGSVTSLAYSDDGTRFLTGSADSTAILWDTPLHERIATLWTHDSGLLSAGLASNEIFTASENGTVYSYTLPDGYQDFIVLDDGDNINSVTISPDGTRMLTAGWNSTKLWDSLTGTELHAFPGSRSGAFSPDGTRVLIGQTQAILWDAGTGKELTTLTGHTSAVNSVVFSPDGTKVLTGSWDRTAKLWDAETGNELITFTGHTARVSSVAFSPDGTQVLTAGDATARIWDVETGGEVATFPRENWEVTSAVFSAEGSMVLTGTLLNVARLWDVQSGGLLRSFTGHTDGVYSAVFSPDETRVLTASGDYTARLWDSQTGEVLRIFSGHTKRVNSVTFFPDGTRVLSGSEDGARLWNSLPGGISSVLDHSPPATYAALSPDGALVASETPDGSTKFSDTQTGATVNSFRLAHTDQVRTAVYSLDGAWLMTGGDDMRAIIHDAATSASLQVFTGHTGAVNGVALSPDGQRFLTASDDSTARLWNVETGATIRILSAHEGAVRSVAFSPDGTQGLTASSDGTAKLWNLFTGFPIREFTGHTAAVVSAEFSPDGSWVLTGSSDDTGRIWSTATGGLIHTLTGHTDAITATAVSNDGLYILTGSSDRTAILWDAQSGEALRTFSGHALPVTVVAMSPDGSRAYTGSDDGAVLSWELSPPRAINVAGGGDYPGNSIARQTHELGVYSYRTLVARGYTPDNILYLSAFPDELSFSSGGDPVAWDLDGDGVDEVDGLATREALLEAVSGDFAKGAGRLMVLMMDHGYRTGEVVAFRLNPTEAVTTTEMNGWLDDLQNAAPVDVTLVVDCCYSGTFVADCKKTDAIPEERQRIVISSTSETAEAVFLPAPDLTSFMHTFLGSAYMGNSMGESFRSGARFFNAFPVAGQVPRIDDGGVDGTDPDLATPRANSQFFGASWAYGVQADRNINRFFTAFDTVTPANSTLAPGAPVTIRAKLLPFQQPLSVTAVIRPPAPEVLSGEPVVGLPRVELSLVDDNFRTGQVWEATLSPTDADFPFAEEGPYRMSATASFNSSRLSDPETVGFTVSSEPDPDATAIRAVLAFGTADGETTNASLADAAAFAYRVCLDRFQSSDGTRHGEWIDLVTSHAVDFSAKSTRASERNAQRELSTRKGVIPGLSRASLLASIAARGAEADRFTLILGVSDASNGVLRLSDTETITAADLDAALDAISPESMLVVIDGPGSGSFLGPLAATSGQNRIVLTSGRTEDCALFIAVPAVSYTHRLLGTLWSGEPVSSAHLGAVQFFAGMANSATGARITPQMDDNGDGIGNSRDGDLARAMVLGRSYAFAGDEASGLPFVIDAEIIPPAAQGERATLRATLLAGVEPATDVSIPDPLARARVFAQFVPTGLECGSGSTNLPRYRLRRDTADGWTWSTQISPGFLPAGTYPMTFYAEYPDGSATKLSELRTAELSVDDSGKSAHWKVF